MINNLQKEYIASRPNVLETLISRYPQKDWFASTIYNKNLSVDFIYKYRDEKMWIRKTLCLDKGLKFDIEKYTDARDVFLFPLVRNIGQDNITIEHLVKYAKGIKGDCWRHLSSLKNIKMEDIENNLDLAWDWESVSDNPNMNIDFARKFKEKLNWNKISKNGGITLKDIDNNLDLPIVRQYVYENPNITFEYIRNHPEENYRIIIGQNTNLIKELENNQDLFHRFLEYELGIYLGIEQLRRGPYSQTVWRFASVFSKKITLEDIENNPELPWHFSAMSDTGCRHINIHFAKKFKDRLKWKSLTYNKGISTRDIYENPDLPWNFDINYNPDVYRRDIDIHFINRFKDRLEDDMYSVSAYSNITMKDVEDNPHIEWDYEGLSKNLKLTIDFVLKNLSKDWDWIDVVKNPNITPEELNTLPDSVSLKWDEVLRNPNLTLDFLKDHLDKPLYAMESNDFLYHTHAYIKNINKDIETRRKLDIDIHGDIKDYILKYYIGYD